MSDNTAPTAPPDTSAPFPEAESTPALREDFKPYPRREAPPTGEFSSDGDGLREAAKELSERRATPSPIDGHIAATAPIVERHYTHPITGEGVADRTLTVSAEDAARDLTALRNAEARAKDAEAVRDIDRVVTAVRDNIADPRDPARDTIPEPEQPPLPPKEPSRSQLHAWP